MVELLTDFRLLVSIPLSIAVAITVYVLASGYMASSKLDRRLQSVAGYRADLRAKRKEGFSHVRGRQIRASTAGGMLKSIVENFRLMQIFDAGAAGRKLLRAGYRGQRPVFVFMTARLAMPFLLTSFFSIYLYFIREEPVSGFQAQMMLLLVFLVSFYLPDLYVGNVIARRRKSIEAAWPDALDLLLICVESGMSVEVSFDMIVLQIGQTSPELAEELALTKAELSYLQNRQQAFVNLADRTGLDTVKAVTVSLIQTEKYGTSLGESLRVVSDESRARRMHRAEEKAAALPPKLTIPMILFFMPVLMGIILGPVILTSLEAFSK